MSNQTLTMRQLLSKAVINEANLPNSILNRQQANRFIDLVIDYSVLLKRIRVVRVDHPKGEINKLDLGSIVTQGASSTTTATTRTPTEGVVNYDMVKYRSAFDLATDFVEDNIEGSNVRNKLINMFTKRIAVDTEMAGIEGNEDLTTGDGQSDSNNLLGVNDGWREILVNGDGTNDAVPSAQQISAAGASPTKKLYYELKRKVPARYRTAKQNYVWVVPSGVYDKWMYDVSARATDAGDDALLKGFRGAAPGPYGIPMIEVPLMPEDLSYGTQRSDCGDIWLTPLQNLIFFIQRDVTIEWDRQPRTDKWEVTVHFRVDFQVENTAMVVLAKDVAVDGSDYS